MKKLYEKLSYMAKSSVLILTLIASNQLLSQNNQHSNNFQCHIHLQPDSIIYVDDNNSSGPWTGTIAYPFQNIPEGLALADSGATVYVLPGSYPLENDLLVEQDVSLFLDTCVVVQFSANTGLKINGSLYALGMRNDSIKFISSQPGETWKGIRFENSQLCELRFCKIENCIGWDDGRAGAIYAKSANPILNRCLIQNSSADYGGGVYCDSLSEVTLSKCVFKYNNASLNGGGIFASQTKGLTVNNCTFYNNNSASFGGAVYLKNTIAHLTENYFSANQSENGGAVYLDEISENQLDFSWNHLEGNIASANGGALCISNCGDIEINRNLFQGNLANSGGAVALINSEIGLFSNTIYDNEALNSGAGLFSENGNNSIYNNIIWNNNSPGNLQIDGSGLIVTYNDVEGGFDGEGNFDADPFFISAELDDYHLDLYSPCIDAGDPISKMDSDNTVADVGAYFYAHLPTKVILQPEEQKLDEGQDAIFKTMAQPALAYLWQKSTNDGETWVDLSENFPYSGTNDKNLSISSVTLDMHDYKYRCRVRAVGVIPVYSDPAVLKVYANIRVVAGNEIICPGEVSVPVCVEDFIGVSAMSLTMEYDTLLLDFTGYDALHDSLSREGDMIIVNDWQNKIFLTWISTNEVSIYTDTIFKFRFNSIGFGSTELAWDTLTPGNCELTHIDETLFNDYYINGSVEIYKPPEIVENPTNITIGVGENAYFNISVEGTELTYQWQESTNGGDNWAGLLNDEIYSGVSTNVLQIITPPLIMNGYQYRCLVSGGCQPAVESVAAILNVNPVITVIADNTVTCPDTAIVHISAFDFYNVASFSLTLSYDTSSISWFDFKNKHDLLKDGLFVINAFQDKIFLSWAHQEAVSIGSDTLIDLRFVSLGGSSNLVWDFQEGGSCEFSDNNGIEILSNYQDGSLEVYFPTEIISSPSDVTVGTGEGASFSINASGHELGRQWQESADNGANWTSLENGGVYSGVSLSQLNLSQVDLPMNGYRYRCVVSSTCGPVLTSDVAVLTVNPVITVIAGSLESCPDSVLIPIMVEDFYNVGSFSLTLNFDSQVLIYSGFAELHDSVSTNEFIINSWGDQVFFTWASPSSVNIGNDTLVVLHYISQGGVSTLEWDAQTQGNCEFSDPDGNSILTNYTNGNINVFYKPSINLQPNNITVIEGENANFNFASTGTSLSFQWQKSINGGEIWQNLENTLPYSGVNTQTLAIEAALPTMDAYQYRCVVIGTCTPELISNEVLLTVLPPPQLITTTASTITSSCTGNLFVPITAKNFEDVAAFSLTLNFNASAIEFDGYHNLHPLLSSTDALFVVNASGYSVYMSWVSTVGETIGNNDTLVEFYFKSEGQPSDLIWDTISYGFCEFIDSKGSLIQSNYVNGSLSVTANPLVANAGDNSVIDQGETITLHGFATGGQEPYTYLWDTGETNSSIDVSPATNTMYHLMITDHNNCEAMDFVVVEVNSLPQQIVTIVPGWSGLSSYIVTANPDVEFLFSEHTDNLVILLNHAGEMFWPGQEVNTIIDWNTQDGYIIKADNGIEVAFSGSMETEKSLNLEVGWNLIPVISECEVDVSGLFSVIDVTIAKEVAGTNVFWPEFEITTLYQLNPGEAYYVLMDEAGVVEFPECTPIPTFPLKGEGGEHPTNKPKDNGGKQKLNTYRSVGVAPCVGTPLSSRRGVGGEVLTQELGDEIKKTPLTHTIALPVSAFAQLNIKEGDAIAAYDESGNCRGISIFSNTNTSITLFGDDPTTTEKDGFLEQERISFKQISNETELFAQYDASFSSSDGQFSINGVSAIQSLKLESSSLAHRVPGSIEVYPNPTSGELNIFLKHFYGPVEMEVYNIHGEQIQFENLLPQGLDLLIQTDLSSQPKGIYFVSIRNSKTTFIHKVVVL